jgi:NAD(P)-dependent dehydrogenase (short-subunit alcohol dehydrogenase family)
MGQVMNVEGCTALVTGANRGLGRALAGMLVQRGARKVYAAARLLDGVQCGTYHVCADEYSKSIFRTLFAAPESIEREMQAEWRKSLTASGNAP